MHDAVRADEAVLVAVGADKAKLLRSALDRDADRVQFADMAQVGRNPTRIISVWRRFLAASVAEGRGASGIGEPVWAARTETELVECQRHELLLNLAFADSPPWSLLCPYDVETLTPAVVEESCRSHRFVRQHSDRRESATYLPVGGLVADLDRPLPEPDRVRVELPFDVHTLRAVRQAVAREARRAGLDDDRTGELVFAVNEVASNSVRYGGGAGTLRLWQERAALVCEIRDGGTVADLLVGRGGPADDAAGRRGLWLVNELCDLVQLRSSAGGTVVRLHMVCAAAAPG